MTIVHSSIQQGFGRKNILINGNFNIWQRGTAIDLTSPTAVADIQAITW